MTEMASPKNKRRRRGGPNARGELRRKELTDSAEALLTKRKIQDLSYTEIADDAGVSLPSCYHFYKNRLQLFQAVSERLAKRYRLEVFEQQLSRDRYENWEDVVDRLVDCSTEFVKRHPAAVEVWYSIHAPPYVRARTTEREKGLAASFQSLLEQHFILPNIGSFDRIVYVFWEGFDSIFKLSYTQNDGAEFFREEAKRLGKAYLRCYLPQVLPPSKPQP